MAASLVGVRFDLISTTLLPHACTYNGTAGAVQQRERGSPVLLFWGNLAPRYGMRCRSGVGPGDREQQGEQIAVSSLLRDVGAVMVDGYDGML